MSDGVGKRSRLEALEASHSAIHRCVGVLSTKNSRSGTKRAGPGDVQRSCQQSLTVIERAKLKGRAAFDHDLSNLGRRRARLRRCPSPRAACPKSANLPPGRRMPCETQSHRPRRPWSMSANESPRSKLRPLLPECPLDAARVLTHSVRKVLRSCRVVLRSPSFAVRGAAHEPGDS